MAKRQNYESRWHPPPRVITLVPMLSAVVLYLLVFVVVGPHLGQNWFIPVIIWLLILSGGVSCALYPRRASLAARLGWGLVAAISTAVLLYVLGGHWW